MTNKVILVLCDGLRYDVAANNMGFLGHLVESKLASLFKVIGEIPSMSRPMYETVHTGLPVIEHGILSNHVVRRSNQPNIFQLTVDAGKTTAAAAYCWFYELYCQVPYDPVNDREVDDSSLPIQHGRFYYQDDYPDFELFAAAAMLVRRFAPDYLLVHPMGMDYLGEIHGADSSEYRNHAIYQDTLLSSGLVEWRDFGYNILVTGDHGISTDKQHGGSTPDVREVPLFLISPVVPGLGDTGKVVSQLQIAPTICRLLSISIPATMKSQPIV